MEDASRCRVCGTTLIAGWCLACETRRWSGLVHRQLVLLMVLVVVTIAAFFGTRAVAHHNETLRRGQAAAWYDAAQRASLTGNPESAVVALRRAVSKDRENRAYRLALADALAARQLDDEARRVLLALRQTQPEDPATNLRLARLEARGADAAPARRYYENALSGLWRPEQVEQRRQTRVELIEFLLARQQRARALSELLLLAATLPDDAAAQADVGRMLLAAGDARLALEHFGRAVRLDATDPDALAGAGEAAFELGDYARALRYLKEAAPDNARATALRDVTELVLSHDPLGPRLRVVERKRRLQAAIDQAMQRLEGCLAATGGNAKDGLDVLRREIRDFESALEGRRQQTADLVDAGVDLMYRAERAAEQWCPATAAPLDRALLLIGRRHGREEQ